MPSEQVSKELNRWVALKVELALKNLILQKSKNGKRSMKKCAFSSTVFDATMYNSGAVFLRFFL